MLFGWYELMDGMGWASSLGLDWTDGCKLFLLHSYCRGPLGLMDFGPLANFCGFGFSLLWIEKMGLYTTILQ
jgi:hypothetical protein